MGDDAYSTLEEIRRDLRDLRQAVVTLAEVQVQQKADRSVFDQYRIDNEAEKTSIRNQFETEKITLRNRIDALASRVNIMSGAAIALAFVIPLLFQWQPWKDNRPADAALTVFATEKRQNQNPPKTLPQPEDK